MDSPIDKIDAEQLNALLNQSPGRVEPVDNETVPLFSRTAMCQIREDAKEQVFDKNGKLGMLNIIWQRAWLDLMYAADKLDAMMARSEAIPCEAEAPGNLPEAVEPIIKWIPVSASFPHLKAGLQAKLTEDIEDALQFDDEISCLRWISLTNIAKDDYFYSESFVINADKIDPAGQASA